MIVTDRWWEQGAGDAARKYPERLDLGTSTCPVCRCEWTLTIWYDALVPPCGCFGPDTRDNPERPCAPCGQKHARACPNMPPMRL